MNDVIRITCQDVLMYFEHKSTNVQYIVNLFILFGKCHIHKCKFAKVSLNYIGFLAEFKEYIKTLALIDTQRSNKTLNICKNIFEEKLCVFIYFLFYSILLFIYIV